MEGKSEKTSSLSKTSALWYALLLTTLFFTTEQFNFFGISNSRLNDTLFQVSYELVESMKFWKSPSNHDIPVVMLFSDEAAKMDNYGWPLQLMDLFEVVEEAYDANAESVYVDLVIRSATHDPEGFCQMIKSLSELTGKNNTFEIMTTSKDISAGTHCLQNTEKLVAYALDKEFFPDQKMQYYGLSEGQKIRTPIIFSAPLEYLRARDGYYNPASIKDEKARKNVEKDFIKAINDWPGIAYLDQVTLLAPYEVGTEDGRSTYIWVDENDYYSPAYIMACLKKKDKNSCQPEEIKIAQNDSYLLWHADSKGRKTLGKEAHILQQQYPDCRDYPQFDLFLQLLSNITPVVKGKLSNCPYYPTIDLVNYGNGSISSPTLKSILKQRNILIGTDMRRFDDHAISPIHGEVPGIYAHATSLDNQIHDLTYQAANNSSDEGRSMSRQLLLLKYSLLPIVFWLFLVFKSSLSKFTTKHKKTLTRVSTLSIFFLLLIITYHLNYDAVSNIVAVVIALLFSGYAVLIIFFHSRIKILLTENKSGKISKYIKDQKEGLYMLFPHLVIIVITFVVCVLLGSWIAMLKKTAPIDIISIFISLVSLYLMACRDDIAGGIARFLGNKEIADTLLD